MSYQEKYLKYKLKYNKLKKIIGGAIYAKHVEDDEPNLGRPELRAALERYEVEAARNVEDYLGGVPGVRHEFPGVGHEFPGVGHDFPGVEHDFPGVRPDVRRNPLYNADRALEDLNININRDAVHMRNPKDAANYIMLKARHPDVPYYLDKMSDVERQAIEANKQELQLRDLKYEKNKSELQKLERMKRALKREKKRAKAEKRAREQQLARIHARERAIEPVREPVREPVIEYVRRPYIDPKEEYPEEYAKKRNDDLVLINEELEKLERPQQPPVLRRQ